MDDNDKQPQRPADAAAPAPSDSRSSSAPPAPPSSSTAALPPRATPPLTPPPLSARPVRRRRRWLGWLIVLLVIIAIGAFAWYRHHSPAAGAAPGGRGGRGAAAGQGAAQTVRVAKVTRGEIPIVRTALGTVTPLATVTVHTRIAGQLMRINFAEGQMVKQGALLALVDPRPYQISLRQAEGTLAHDMALLSQARQDLARYEILLKQDSI
ncbi:MAG: biotin/lipoyl-binding protein, partial [Janthinobacterium lividum]